MTPETDADVFRSMIQNTTPVELDEFDRVQFPGVVSALALPDDYPIGGNVAARIVIYFGQADNVLGIGVWE